MAAPRSAAVAICALRLRSARAARTGPNSRGRAFSIGSSGSSIVVVVRLAVLDQGVLEFVGRKVRPTPPGHRGGAASDAADRGRRRHEEILRLVLHDIEQRVE